MKKRIVIFITAFFIIVGVTAINFYSEQKNKLKIAFLGDSITCFGWELPYGYIQTTLKNLNDKGFDIKAYPAGIKGNLTKQMFDRINYDVLMFRPDIMFFMGGLNDIWFKNESADNYRNNVEQIIKAAQSNKIEVILMTLTVLSEDANDSKNAKVAEYNKVLRQIAVEQKLQLIDTNTPLWKEINRHEKYGCIVTIEDGIHLNEKGNDILASTVTEEFLKTHKPYRLLSANKSTRK